MLRRQLTEDLTNILVRSLGYTFTVPTLATITMTSIYGISLVRISQVDSYQALSFWAGCLTYQI